MFTMEEALHKRVAAQLFFEAKLTEFEAACYSGDHDRLSACERDCSAALIALLDAKQRLVTEQKKVARRQLR